MSSASHIPKLQTLREDMETVSLDDSHHLPHHSPIVKRQASSSTINGLGFHVPRRPSDPILLRQAQKRANSSSNVTVMERPVSNDSILSTNGSEFSENINDNSRNSSITSASIASSSPVLKNNFSTASIESKQLSMNATPMLSKLQTNPGAFKTPMSSTSELSNLSASSLSTIKLTPSQRLKLKRQNSFLKSQKQRETYFEDHYNSDEEQVFEDGLIWNVPYAGGSTVFSPVSGKSSTALKQIIDNSPINMPMSPLPGTISQSFPSPTLTTRNSVPTINTKSIYKHPDEAQSLSRFYEVTNKSHCRQELTRRQKSMTSLPTIVKNASELGLDDMKLYSTEKSNSISSTRPIWLPPKDSMETKKHEADLLKMYEESAKLEKQKKEKHNLLIEAEKKNVIRWSELNGRGLLRNSSTLEIKKLVFKCAVPDYLKYEVWNSFSKHEVMKKKNSELLKNFEKYEDLIKKLQGIPKLPVDKLEFLQSSVSTVKAANSEKFAELNEDKLLELLKLRMISKLGLDSYVDTKLMALLLLKFNMTDTYNLANLMKLNIFNNEIITKKFNENLLKNSILKKYLNHKEYSSDLTQLTFNKVLSILLKLTTRDGDDSKFLYQVLDVLIIHGDYKTHYSLMITILRHYHFGFDDVDDLLQSNELKIVVSDRFQFFERFNYYHRKF